MELQSNLEKIRAEGLGVAAISYDSVAVLKSFAERRGCGGRCSGRAQIALRLTDQLQFVPLPPCSQTEDSIAVNANAVDRRGR